MIKPHGSQGGPAGGQGPDPRALHSTASSGDPRQHGDPDDDQDHSGDLGPPESFPEKEERGDGRQRRDWLPITAAIAMLSREPHADSMDPMTSAIPASTTNGRAARVSRSRRCRSNGKTTPTTPTRRAASATQAIHEDGHGRRRESDAEHHRPDDRQDRRPAFQAIWLHGN